MRSMLRAQAVAGYSSRLRVDKNQGLVWRIGVGSRMPAVEANYNFLQRASGVIEVPVALRKLRVPGGIVTCETYMAGREYVAEEVTAGTLATIVDAIAPLYERTLVTRMVSWRVALGAYASQLPAKAPSAARAVLDRLGRVLVDSRPAQATVVVSLVHGDLTFRNVRLTPRGHCFVDGESSEVAPPTFDVWLLLADLLSHRAERTTHATFLTRLWQTGPDQLPFAGLVAKLYERVTGTARNRQWWSALWLLFLARCVVHSVHDCLEYGKSLDFLDELSLTSLGVRG